MEGEEGEGPSRRPEDGEPSLPPKKRKAWDEDGDAEDEDGEDGAAPSPPPPARPATVIRPPRIPRVPVPVPVEQDACLSEYLSGERLPVVHRSSRANMPCRVRTHGVGFMALKALEMDHGLPDDGCVTRSLFAERPLSEISHCLRSLEPGLRMRLMRICRQWQSILQSSSDAVFTSKHVTILLDRRVATDIIRDFGRCYLYSVTVIPRLDFLYDSGLPILGGPSGTYGVPHLCFGYLDTSTWPEEPQRNFFTYVVGTQHPNLRRITFYCRVYLLAVPEVVYTQIEHLTFDDGLRWYEPDREPAQLTRNTIACRLARLTVDLRHAPEGVYRQLRLFVARCPNLVTVILRGVGDPALLRDLLTGLTAAVIKLHLHAYPETTPAEATIPRGAVPGLLYLALRGLCPGPVLAEWSTRGLKGLRLQNVRVDQELADFLRGLDLTNLRILDLLGLSGDPRLMRETLAKLTLTDLHVSSPTLPLVDLVREMRSLETLYLPRDHQEVEAIRKTVTGVTLVLCDTCLDAYFE